MNMWLYDFCLHKVLINTMIYIAASTVNWTGLQMQISIRAFNFFMKSSR